MNKRTLVLSIIVCVLCLLAPLAFSESAGATPVQLQQKYVLRLESKEAQWFAVTADDEPAYYHFNITNIDIGTWVYLELYDENGLSLSKTEAGKSNTGWLSWKIPQGKTYTFAVYPYKNKSGQYSLTVDRVSDPEPNDRVEAKPILPEADTAASLDGTSDTDWFSLSADAEPAYYRFSITNIDVKTWVYLELFDENGLSLGRAEANATKTGWISLKIPVNTTYTCAVYAYKKHSMGKYRVLVEKTPDPEPNERENANALILDMDTAASLGGSSDADCFSLTAGEAPAYYRFSITNIDIDTLVYMELFDENGLSLGRAEASQKGTGWISRKIPEGKIYSICVYAYDKHKTGRYHVRAEMTPDPEPNTQAEAIPLVFGNELPASLGGTGDADWFSLTADEAPAYYQFTVTNTNIDTWLYMELYDENGLSLGRAEAGTAKSASIQYRIPQGKTYAVCIYPYDKRVTGQYRVLGEQFLDQEPDDRQSALTLPEAGAELSASLDGKGDNDWFAFTAPEELCWASLSLTSEEDMVYATLYDQAGSELYQLRVRSGDTQTLTFQLNCGERYELLVYGESSARVRHYRVALSQSPDIGGSSPETAYVPTVCVPFTLSIASGEDIDYAAFPSGAIIVLKLTSGGPVTVTERQENGFRMNQGEEAHIILTEAGVIGVAGKQGVLEVSYCLPEQHIAGEIKVERESTCFSEGEQLVTCRLCGSVIQTEAIGRLPHTPSDEWTILREASCAEEGEQTINCVVCGESLQKETLPVIAHRPSDAWTTTRAPTCTVEGERVKYCAVCGEIVQSEALPALEHANAVWKIESEATCLQDGIQTLVCPDCEKVLQRERITAVGHIAAEKTETIPAGCETEGSNLRRCVVCGEVLEEEKLPSTGHHFGEWVVVKEATKQEEGEKQRVCEGCGLTESEPIEKIPWWHF